jgi:hypothetical protein
MRLSSELVEQQQIFGKEEFTFWIIVRVSGVDCADKFKELAIDEKTFKSDRTTRMWSHHAYHMPNIATNAFQALSFQKFEPHCGSRLCPTMAYVTVHLNIPVGVSRRCTGYGTALEAMRQEETPEPFGSFNGCDSEGQIRRAYDRTESN